MRNTYLSFIIANELYAVNVSKVLEVLEKQDISRVPNAPGYIRGIVNFRGEIVPVFESRMKFNLTPRDENDPYVIVVLDLSNDSEALRIGAIVDKVKDVLEIDASELKSVPAMSKDFNTKFLQGIFKLKDKFILLIDVDRVFTDAELETIQETNYQEN